MQEYELDRIFLVPNGVESQREGQRLYTSINTVVQNFLNGQVKYLHSISADSMVVQAMKASQPVVTYSPASLAARDFGDLAKKILQLDNDVPLNGNIQFFVERVAAQLTDKAS
jgi:flagellar biosynthesis protein FlhG